MESNESTTQLTDGKVEKKLKAGGNWCAAHNCTNSRRKKGIRLFSFPKDEDRLVSVTHLYKNIQF